MRSSSQPSSNIQSWRCSPWAHTHTQYGNSQGRLSHLFPSSLPPLAFARCPLAQIPATAKYSKGARQLLLPLREQLLPSEQFPLRLVTTPLLLKRSGSSWSNRPAWGRPLLWTATTLARPMCLQYLKLCLVHSRCFLSACWMNERRSDEILPVACFSRSARRLECSSEGFVGQGESIPRVEHKEAVNGEMVKGINLVTSTPGYPTADVSS